MVYKVVTVHYLWLMWTVSRGKQTRPGIGTSFISNNTAEPSLCNYTTKQQRTVEINTWTATCLVLNELHKQNRIICLWNLNFLFHNPACVSSHFIKEIRHSDWIYSIFDTEFHALLMLEYFICGQIYRMKPLLSVNLRQIDFTFLRRWLFMFLFWKWRWVVW
jgi:hypothetical protein